MQKVTYVNPSLPFETQINLINSNTQLLQGMFESQNADKLELDFLHSTIARKWLRSIGVGNTAGTYTGWTHFKAEAGYSIWKYTISGFAHDANNLLYIDGKSLKYMGQATTESSTSFDKVFLFDGVSTYADNTTEAGSDGGTPFGLLADTNDYLYIGHATQFSGADFELATLGGGHAVVVEYSKGGSAWGTMATANITDNTQSLLYSGNMSFIIPGDWATDTVNSVDSKYWIRIKTTTAPTVRAYADFIKPINSVASLLSLSSMQYIGTQWAWCSLGTTIYVTIRNLANSLYEGDYYITSTSSSANKQNFFVSNHQFTADYVNSDAPTNPIPLIFASKYATLQAAITAIGATEATLMLDVPKNASNAAEAVTVPATLSLMPMRSGSIAKGAATSLSIAHITGNPMHQIFSGFAASQILGLKKAKVEWFGAVGDGTTNDSVALQLAFDWLTYSSNRTLKMKGKYRANSMLSLYALQSVENSHNCVLDAYGAVVESYVNGTAVHIGKDGEEVTNQTARFQYNTVQGLKVQAMNTSVHTLLRIGGQYSYASWYKDISLVGFYVVSPLSRTKQGLLFFSRNGHYNRVTNIHIENCDYEIVNGRDMNNDTYISSAEPCNANVVDGALLYNMGVHGIGLYLTAANRFINIDLEAGSTATSCRDVYFGKGASDNIVSARHERVNYDLALGPHTHEFSTTATTPTGNTAESNLNLVVKDSAAAGYNTVIADNILIKLSSANNGLDVNHVTTRWITNHVNQSISIRQNQFLAGEDAIMINSDGVHVGNLIQTLKTPTSAGDTGLTGQIVWDTNYIYICTGTNTWKRAAIITWP